MNVVDKLMKTGVSDGVFPAGALLVASVDKIIFQNTYGWSNPDKNIPVTKDTIFDLASLTKPLATTLAVLNLFQCGKIDITDCLGELLPVFFHTDKRDVTIKNLLCHNSGLPAHRPYYEELMKEPPGNRKNLLKKLLVAEPLVHEIGTTVVYSDIGFMILCWLVEHLAGESLDLYVQKKIYAPLNIDCLFFPGVPLKSAFSHIPVDRYAVTELCPWRKTVLQGAVDDDNAYSVGGVDGHAGLFGTIGGVYQILREILTCYEGISKHRIFSQDMVRRFLQEEKGTGRTLGFDMPDKENASSGKYFSKNTVGHLGFTGTSFWMDLQKLIFVVLLTNRIHPTRENLKIRKFRPLIHNAVMEYFFGC